MATTKDRPGLEHVREALEALEPSTQDGRDYLAWLDRQLRPAP